MKDIVFCVGAKWNTRLTMVIDAELGRGRNFPSEMMNDRTSSSID